MSRQTRIDQFYKAVTLKKGKSSEISNDRNNTSSRMGRRKQKSVSLPLSTNRKPTTSKQRNNTQDVFNESENNTRTTASGRPRSVDKDKRNSSNRSLESILGFIMETPERLKEDAHESLIERRNSNIDRNLLTHTIEHLNLRAEGAIPNSNFDLCKIYAEKEYIFQYNAVGATTLVRYKLKDVKIPKSDLYCKLLFTIITNILSSPINCSYFEKDELDLVYSVLTLPEHALMLFVRLLKRRRSWFRKSNLNYPEIEKDLETIFDLLASCSICMFDFDREDDLKKLLDLLQVDEARRLCRLLKINATGKKESCIRKLEAFAKSKPLFAKEQSQAQRVCSLVSSMIGRCIALTDKTWDVFDKIMTLLIPGQYPTMSISDIFFLLINVDAKKRTFPRSSTELFPIFSSRQHLVRYIEGANAFAKTMDCIERKDWAAVKELGCVAKIHVLYLIPLETKYLKLPAYVKRFTPGYTWLKVLSKSVDAYKKFTDDKTQAVEILKLLVSQDSYMQDRKGKWYNELALIQMHDYKNFDDCAETIVKAMSIEDISIVDRVDLLERAIRIAKKRNGVVKPATKEKINALLNSWKSRLPCAKDFSTASTEIQAPSLSGNAGYKRKWCIETGAEGESYGSVEMLAMRHYITEGYPSGLHCEGSLPVTLFSVLFWDELYTAFVPGTRVSVYQTAPHDLLTNEFYMNRKEQIDTKLETFSRFNIDTFSTRMQDAFNRYCNYESIIPAHLFQNDGAQIKEIVCCLGVDGTLGICRQLLNNFKIWSAGFPDLIVWNSQTYRYKIVEVKGPTDTLSTKQKLWLQHLQSLGVITEVCYVRNKGVHT